MLKKLFPPVLLMGLIFLLFSNTFFSTWTYDDFKLIVNNPDIRSLDLFMKDLQPGRIGRELSLLLDYQLFGLKPAGFHIQNILWHGINAILITILVARLGGSRFAAFYSAILFAAHPVQVEVVANLSHRKDSIALAFILLAFLAYMEIFRTSRKKIYWFILALIFFLAAVNTKQNALILPVILIIYEFLFINEKDRLILKDKRIFSALFICIFIYAGAYILEFVTRDNYLFLLKSHLYRQNYFGPDILSAHYMLALKSWSFMLLKLLIPLQLAIEYILTVPDSIFNVWVLLTIASILSLPLLLVNYRKISPPFLFSILWITLFLLPTSNILPVSYYAADRYLYTPSVGFFIIIGLCLDKIKYKSSYIKYGLLSLLVFILIVLTWNQNAVWKSPTTLWTHVYKVNPTSIYALNNNGIIYIQKGEKGKALEFFHKALETNPLSSTAQYNLGYLYESAGDREKARQYYINFVNLDNPEFQKEVKAIRKKLNQSYNVEID